MSSTGPALVAPGPSDITGHFGRAVRVTGLGEAQLDGRGAGTVVIDGDRRAPVVDRERPERPTHRQGLDARDELGGLHGLRL